MGLLNRLRSVGKQEEWIIAYRKKGDKLLFEKNGEEKPFTIVPNTIRYWCADPFIIAVGTCDYLFFEMFDRMRNKGVIGYRTILENGKVGRVHVAYESQEHLSFPFVFQCNGNYYMMPESSYEKRIMLLKADHFPEKWSVIDTWFQGQRFCDSVLFKDKKKTYLFTQPVDIPYTNEKLNIYIRNNEEWKPHNGNPVIKNQKVARMAGAIFRYKDRIIRPSQNCLTYGNAINFCEIEELTNEEYKERIINTISAEQLKVNHIKSCYRGIHTYNFSERYEIIDLKYMGKLNLFYVIGRIYCSISRLFQ